MTAQQLLWLAILVSVGGMLFEKEHAHSAHLGGLFTGVAYYFMMRTGRFF